MGKRGRGAIRGGRCGRLFTNQNVRGMDESLIIINTEVGVCTLENEQQSISASRKRK